MNEIFNKIALLAAEVSAAETKVKADNTNISQNGRETIRAYVEKLLPCIAPIKTAAAHKCEDCEFTTHDVQFRLNETRIECILYSGPEQSNGWRPAGVAFSFGVNDRRLAHHAGYTEAIFSNAALLEHAALIDKFASIPVEVIEKHVAEWCIDKLRVRLQNANANVH